MTLLTGMVDPDGAGYREYYVARCARNFSLFELFSTFAAHQQEWNSMGLIDPWYSVLTSVRRGSNISEAQKLAFYESGVLHVTKVVQRQTMRSHRWRPSSVLDFGCGLGRLAFAFAHAWPTVTRVACVDQSASHLRTAAREWRKRRGNTTAELSFVQSTPDLLGALGGRRFDFVHSVLVLQHMMPPLQVAYLEQLCDALAPNGRGFVQLPSGDAGCKLYRYPGVAWSNTWLFKREHDPCDFQASVRAGGMQMHYTPAEDAIRALRKRGCSAHAHDAGEQYTGGGKNCHSAVLTFRKATKAS